MTLKGLALFDIDGVIRDVGSSYRLAVKQTVQTFCGWLPTNQDIDSLKSDGFWNNDWDVTLELIKRHIVLNNLSIKTPYRNELISKFNNFYFGGMPSADPKEWKGFIRDEKLLVNKKFFEKLTEQNVGWGFVSGAEIPSAKFVLETRIGLDNPPLLAMGDAPDKPDPAGLIQLSSKLFASPLGNATPPIAYLGDTVADILTIQRARKKCPDQLFISLGVAPPHLHIKEKLNERKLYEDQLKNAGADLILNSTNQILEFILSWN